MSLVRRSLVLAATGAALAAPALIRAAAAQGAPPSASAQQQPQAPYFFRFKVGEFTVTMVHDRSAARPNPLQAFILNAEPAQVEAALRDGALPTTNLPNPYTVTFIDTGRGVVAFDAGTGAR